MKLAALIVLIAFQSAPAMAQSSMFGDDSSEWANDGECDDTRFKGVGMASNLRKDQLLRDATDCMRAFVDGRIKVWDKADAMAATSCSAINFGEDRMSYFDVNIATNGKCSDARFKGEGTSYLVLAKDIRKDATDCRLACEAGTIFLRDY